MDYIRFASTCITVFVLAGCSTEATRVMTPDGMQAVSWTHDDRMKDIAVHHLRRTETASHHLVRLSGSEVPHTHEKSDLTVTVLSGRVLMHLGGHVLTVGPGQVIDVPRGTPHFAENLSSSASEAYTVFSPPLDPGDNHPTAAQ